MNHVNSRVPLTGIDASNPLAFLAALGTLVVASRFAPSARMKWETGSGRLFPVLLGVAENSETFLDALTQELQSLPTTVFDVNPRLPFDADSFRAFLLQAAMAADLRDAAFGCALGSEVCRDDKSGTFRDTAFRMVRSGDSGGNGLLAYAKKIRETTDATCLRRTLFIQWDYADAPPEFRWDPAGDRPYALGWRDPSKTATRTMLGANSLALEALPLFPVVPEGSRVRTTGFSRIEKQVFFTWPVWSFPLAVDVIRSLLALSQLSEKKPDRSALMEQGIFEVYRCRRFASSQYYSNFSPAEPA